MKPKIYSLEKVEEAAKALANAPPLPSKHINQDLAIKKLSKHIKELHKNKNYEPRQIVNILKENGMKITLKEVKEICFN